MAGTPYFVVLLVDDVVSGVGLELDDELELSELLDGVLDDEDDGEDDGDVDDDTEPLAFIDALVEVSLDGVVELEELDGVEDDELELLGEDVSVEAVVVAGVVVVVVEEVVDDDGVASVPELL